MQVFNFVYKKTGRIGFEPQTAQLMGTGVEGHHAFNLRNQFIEIKNRRKKNQFKMFQCFFPAIIMHACGKTCRMVIRCVQFIHIFGIAKTID